MTQISVPLADPGHRPPSTPRTASSGRTGRALSTPPGASSVPRDDVFVRRRRGLRRAFGGAAAPARRTRSTRDDQELTSELKERRSRIGEAYRSLETVFQPIVDLQSGRPVGVESLARFNLSPARPPNEWFLEAAELGLGVQLELVALRSALEQLHRLPSGLYLSLNASPTAMMAPQFLETITRVPADRLVLEVTEHTEIDDYPRFGSAIDHLRSNGARLAVDDAGSGYASFLHVLNLRPDVIKLDIGLTRGIDADPARRALGSALLHFGFEAYRASMVAEGIETAGELQTLRDLGCGFGQGFYLGRPGRLPTQ